MSILVLWSWTRKGKSANYDRKILSTVKILNELRKTKDYPNDRGLSVDCSFMTALICLGQLVSSAIVGVLIESYGSSRDGFQSKETVGVDRGLLSLLHGVIYKDT